MYLLLGLTVKKKLVRGGRIVFCGIDECVPVDIHDTISLDVLSYGWENVAEELCVDYLLVDC